MTKVNKTTLLLVIDLICVIIAFVFFDGVSMNTIAIITSITVCLEIVSIININNCRLTLTSSLLLYTIATQFGLFLPYAFFGKAVLTDYSDYTLRFLDSPYLIKAVILGNIAVLTFDIVRRITYSYYRKNRAVICKEALVNKISDASSNGAIYRIGIIMLIVVILFFAYNILTGKMSLFGTYESFMNNSVYNSNLYSYVLIVFYVGTIYLSCSGKIMDRKFGWFLWLLLVVFFAFNGNKGEFLYSLLTVLGIKGLEGQKIGLKSLGIIALLMFLVIPSISSLRGEGIVNNLSNFKFNFFDAFTEMGMQIRTSVYSLSDLESGRVGYLYGASYWKPIVNIINPFSIETATAHIRQMYPGYGYTQVIESYMNFGLYGVLAFFSAIGYFLGKFETTFKDKLQLAYYGTITCIFINASRNYFAFVPGQILIVTVVYLLSRLICEKKNN